MSQYGNYPLTEEYKNNLLKAKLLKCLTGCAKIKIHSFGWCVEDWVKLFIEWNKNKYTEIYLEDRFTPYCTMENKLILYPVIDLETGLIIDIKKAL